MKKSDQRAAARFLDVGQVATGPSLVEPQLTEDAALRNRLRVRRGRRHTCSPAPLDGPPIARPPPLGEVSPVGRPDSEPRPCVSRSNHLIAVSTSLSPRPERLTRIRSGWPWGGGASRPANFSAPARA